MNEDEDLPVTGSGDAGEETAPRRRRKRKHKASGKSKQPAIDSHAEWRSTRTPRPLGLSPVDEQKYPSAQPGQTADPE